MQNFNGMDMNNYFMFQHFLNSQRNNAMFNQNMNNMNFNQNMFQQCMNQMNQNQNFNQPNFNFNPNMNIGNFNNVFLQNMFQMFCNWMMAQNMNMMNNNNINNNNNYYINQRFNNCIGNNNINNNITGGNNGYRNFNYSLYNNNREPKPILPRIQKLINVPDFQNQNNLLNIVFVAGNGLRVNIPIPYNKTVEYLFKIYAQKIGISENVLGNGVIFLYDALIMDVNDKRTLGEVFHGNQYVITVVDAANVLAA